LRDLGFAAQLHDIGKVGVPDAVLRKPGRLTVPEWDLLKGHAEWGAQLLEGIPGLRRVATIVRHHHERYDGSGYPVGLAGEEIPLESRVLGVADAYTAMVEQRPYRRPLRPGEVERRLTKGRGTQFDPMVVDALFDVGFERPCRGEAASVRVA
jgi:HD-GYP domain-containing protein (c-di-GMP phosphodiesterase class II)